MSARLRGSWICCAILALLGQVDRKRHGKFSLVVDKINPHLGG
jgi:hypothetical protein